MRTCSLFFVLFNLYFCSLWSQQDDGISSLTNMFKSNSDSISKSKLPDIKKYLILNAIKDSTYLDTTLSIKKHYKFNYLRKDDFELLKFSNIGQTYNALTHKYDRKSFLPSFSFSFMIV